MRSTARTDGRGYALLYDRYLDRALGLAGLLCGDRERAEDAVAEAFVRVLVRWRDGAVESFWPYLRTAVVNEVRGQHRRTEVADRYWRRSRLELVAAESGSVVERTYLADCLGQLPHRQRLAVVLRHLEDLSEAETARLMGCSVGTVKSNTSRGIALLRELLTEEER